MISNFSIVKPCGLLSLRTELIRFAPGDKRALGNVAGADDPLPGIGYRPIGIVSHIQRHRINLNRLI